LTRTLLNDIIQLLMFLTNVEHSLYKYASVMQQMDSSSWGLFKITYATNITFVIDPKKIGIYFYHECDYIYKKHKW
jgi:hypothetical protein